jgi:hypothetical protein
MNDQDKIKDLEEHIKALEEAIRQDSDNKEAYNEEIADYQRRLGALKQPSNLEKKQEYVDLKERLRDLQSKVEEPKKEQRVKKQREEINLPEKNNYSLDEHIAKEQQNSYSNESDQSIHQLYVPRPFRYVIGATFPVAVGASIAAVNYIFGSNLTEKELPAYGFIGGALSCFLPWGVGGISYSKMKKGGWAVCSLAGAILGVAGAGWEYHRITGQSEGMSATTIALLSLASVASNIYLSAFNRDKEGD